MRSAVMFVFAALAGLVAGCPVTQPQDTPVSPKLRTVAETGERYWLYVPSYYEDTRDWPLVVTLHGTHGWDGSKRQIMEWKFLAEQHGLIVIAPRLRSVQGILPVIPKVWRSDLEKDERSILSAMDHVAQHYCIDPNSVLLTGFSAGGYPMYYTGLRHPERFSMLIARACNSRIDLFEEIELTDRARQLPIFIFWGKDDLQDLRDQSWQAFRYLRERGFSRTRKKKIRGGHIRHPEIAYRYWRAYLPERHIR